MKKRSISVLFCTAAMIFGLSACGSQPGTDSPTGTEAEAEKVASDRDTFFQVSLLQGLTLGDYHGSVSVKELKRKGDIGLGTFDGLDGEMIMLDGSVYKAKGDGTVELADDSETIPFCGITFFDDDESWTVENIESYDKLLAILNKKVEENGVNRFYAARITGRFSQMNVRSEYAQEEPYKPLAQVLEKDQTFYDYSDIDGTIVAMYCPPYMSDLNATGWHLHFISDDKAKGGHVLGLQIEKADISLDLTDNFEMKLPDNDTFSDFDLTIDQSEDIKKVETDVDRK